MTAPPLALIAKVLGATCVLLIVACACLLFWGRAGYALSDRWETKSIAERDAHRTTKENVRAAQVAAATAAEAARLATEAHSRQLAERADNAEQDLAAARDAAARFADARRLQHDSGGAARSPASDTGAASQADAAARGDRPGADAVVLTRAEYDQFAGNTLRLEQVRQWGQSLIDAGLAVVSGTDGN